MTPEVLYTNADTLRLHIVSLKDMLGYYQNELTGCKIEEQKTTLKVLKFRDKLSAAQKAQNEILTTN